MKTSVLLEPKRIETPHCIRKSCISEEASNLGWFGIEDACNYLHPRRGDMLKKIIKDIPTYL